MKNKPILIVAGTPKSVFFEIFFKSIRLKKYKSPLVLICSKELLKKNLKEKKINLKINVIKIDQLKNIKNDFKNINLLNVSLLKSKNDKKNSKYISKYIHECFCLAFKIISSGFTHKFINGPINKKFFLKNKYLGITEYISKYFNRNNVGMLIYNKKLSVSLVTTHLPLKQVVKKINKHVIEKKISLINEFYKKQLKIKPKIAVTGLNPHCETILKYDEDKQIISKAIISQKKRGVSVFGPFPSDTIFLKSNRTKYDVILGMYHDQVLTPMKTLYEFDAINVTMGLPFLRVSPDHGPNEQMVGKNISNPLSLIRAIEFLQSK